MCEADSIDLGRSKFDEEVEWRKFIKINPNDENLLDVHFDHFFPLTKGHARLIDECHSSRKSLHCSTVKKI